MYVYDKLIDLSVHVDSELDDEDSIVDVEALSDNESSSVIEPDRENYRIRTLAEHIIAAIPDR